MKPQKLIESQELIITQAQNKIEFVKQEIEKLKNLPDCHLYGHFLDFDYLTHEEIIKIIKAFPGKWEKIFSEKFIDYTNCTYNPKIEIRCWKGEPPPSCKLVTEEVYIEEVTIPAHKEMKIHLVCKEE